MSIGNVFQANTAKTALAAVHGQAIVDLATRTGVGQFSSQMCPECGGGGSKERSLSLNVEPNGQIKYHCHRAACGLSGTVYSRPDALPTVGEGAAATQRVGNPLTADIHPLSDRELAWFSTRFNLDSGAVAKNVKRTEHRYALPLWSPEGATRGWITRRPWDGSPADTLEARGVPQWQLKALTYMEGDDPVMSWYGRLTVRGSTYLVEDPISALRLAAFKQDAMVVALMGTGVNVGKVAELQRYTSKLIIALDYDATGQAFAMARKWGQAFSSTRVVVLPKDIKDCSGAELEALPL